MGDARYRVQSTSTNEVFHLPLYRIQDYATKVNPNTGKPLYRVLDALPGIAVSPGGRTEQTLVPPDRVAGSFGEHSPLRVMTSADDPLWEVARRSAVESAKDQAAEDRGSFLPLVEGVASVATAGGYPALVNAMAGEGAAEARARSVNVHGWEHFAGSAAGLLVAGMLPIPGLGRIAVGASKGLRAGTIFELGAKSANVARGIAYGGKKASEVGFSRELAARLAGPIAFGATVDAPLSAALVAADMVDRDKPFTAEAFSADFATQYLLSVGLAAATSIPFAIGGAALRAAGKKAVRGGDALMAARDSDTALMGMSRQDLLDSGFRGVWRYGNRKWTRGRAHGLGDTIENLGYRFWSKRTKAKGQLASEHWLGRLMAGNDSDEWIKLSMTRREAIEGIANATSPKQLKKYGNAILGDLADGDLTTSLASAIKDADKILVAKRKAKDMIVDGARMAETWRAAALKHPPKAVTGAAGDAAEILNKGLEAAGLKRLPKNFGDFNKRLDYVLENRFKADPVSREALYDAMNEAFPGMSQHVGPLRHADTASDRILDMASRYGADTQGLIDPTKLSSAEPGGINMRNQIRAIDGPLRKFRALNSVRDMKPFLEGARPLYAESKKELRSLIDTRFDDIAGELQHLSNVNRLVAQLRKDAVPFIKSKVPATHAEILGAQVGTVMNVKQRIATTLQYIAFKGGAARHTATFGGVFAFREINSAHEKRAIFAALHESISSTASVPNDIMNSVSPYADTVARWDLDLGTAFASAQMGSLAYLSMNLPRSDIDSVPPEDYSMAEIENYLEIVGALIDPISALATARDGSVTETAVDAISTVYPALYAETVLDVAEFADKYGDSLTHHAWIGLDTFTKFSLGYIDSNASPIPAPYAQTPQQSQAIGGPENRRMTYQQTATPAQRLGVF